MEGFNVGIRTLYKVQKLNPISGDWQSDLPSKHEALNSNLHTIKKINKYNLWETLILQLILPSPT
jgi:hypothetical protein